MTTAMAMLASGRPVLVVLGLRRSPRSMTAAPPAALSGDPSMAVWTRMIVAIQATPNWGPRVQAASILDSYRATGKHIVSYLTSLST